MAALSDVSCLSPSDCWAVGASGANAVIMTTAPTGSMMKVKCTAFDSGSNSTHFELEGCSGDTGAASLSEAANLSTSNPLYLSWSNGTSTTVDWNSITTGGADCASGSTEYTFEGEVTADTTGWASAGGAAKGTACEKSISGKLKVAPASDFVFK